MLPDIDWQWHYNASNERRLRKSSRQLHKLFPTWNHSHQGRISSRYQQIGPLDCVSVHREICHVLFSYGMVTLARQAHLLIWFKQLTVRISSLRISAALRLAYLRALFAQPVSVIDTISPGKVSTRITTNSNTVQLAIGPQFALLLQSLAFTTGLYVVAFIKGWLLTLVASASLPFVLMVYGALLLPYIRIHKVTEKHHEDASAMAFEMFSSIRVLVAFGAEGKLARQHASMLDKAAQNEKKVAPLMGMMMAPAMLSMYATFAITFWFGIKQYTEGKIPDVGVIITVLFSVMMAIMNVGRLAVPLIAIAKASSAATELFVTIDAPVADANGLKEPQITAAADIAFENVSFSYPNRPYVPVIQGLDLRLEAGKVTAIVGPSGSGKSTIVGLIQRWYDLLGTTAIPKTADAQDASTTGGAVKKRGKPKRKWLKNPKASENSSKDCQMLSTDDKTGAKIRGDSLMKIQALDLGPNTCTGTIQVGSMNLRAVDLNWWRSQIGLVQQEPFLFNDTLFNNVAFGLCGTDFHELPRENKLVMVKEACREACAEEFIERLPQGYDTLVGENGIRLSGGQRQRIAIARSIVKQPTILILDEATSAIDVRTELIVQQALDRVSKNRTTLIIAHRLSTIKKADKIVVLRQGKLVEQGSHNDLLNIEAGVYYGLVHAQELAIEAECDLEDEPLSGNVKSVNVQHLEELERGCQISETAPMYEDRGMFNSFGRLLAEQRHHWILYSITLLAVLAAGAVYALQAYIFANVINVFTFLGPQLVKKGNFWAGMFGVLAAGCGLTYFILGTVCHLLSITITQHYRSEYLDNMIRKHIGFFDDQGHSPGSLTSRLSADCEQLQQLMSTEMSYAMISGANLVFSVIISLIYGWKLSLVGLFAALPLILAAGWVRMGLEIKFESENFKIFEDSSQFASEAVGAFRTVLSLTMGDVIGDRYQTLLEKHVAEAFSGAKYGMLIFATSDSIELACIALVRNTSDHTSFSVVPLTCTHLDILVWRHSTCFERVRSSQVLCTVHGYHPGSHGSRHVVLLCSKHGPSDRRSKSHS
jgi:ATP-binding cassette subfamily B (MDR/TAP) protein 1